MNRLLDLETLLHENKTRERFQLETFESVLVQCHDVISRHNREDRVRECTFHVPPFIFGKPPYDYNVLVNYLIHHLTDNGLLAKYQVDTGKLYISWRDEDIDVDKYIKRKTIVNSQNQPFSENNVKLIDNMPVNGDKYNQAKRLQRQREREFRLSIQKNRVPAGSNFNEFLKTMY
jgi:hypothetical protein